MKSSNIRTQRRDSETIEHDMSQQSTEKKNGHFRKEDKFERNKRQQGQIKQQENKVIKIKYKLKNIFN